MSVINRIAVIAGVLALASLSSAQNGPSVDGSLSVVINSSSGTASGDALTQSCSASANSSIPSASSSLSFTQFLGFVFSSPSQNPTFPTSVSASFQETIGGSYSYVIFGSTTPKGAVSADYFAQTDEGAVSVRDKSGTINQTGTEQSKDSTPQTITGGTSGTVTVSTRPVGGRETTTAMVPTPLPSCGSPTT